VLKQKTQAKKHSEKNPSAAPFENPAVGKQITLKVW
jgi:hypothetical protein